MDLQLTAAQASAVTGLSVKAINKAIDSGTIPSTARAKNGIRRRYVSELALVCLKLEAKGLGELPLSFRKRIFHLVLTHPEKSKRFRSTYSKRIGRFWRALEN
jgi:hypothetical protein